MPRLPALFALALALAACHRQPEEVRAGDAWLRLPAVADRPGAAYFKVTGDARDHVLVNVSTPVARRTELHESMKTGEGAAAMSTMKPIDNVPLPPGGTIRFAPGGKHVMLFGLEKGLHAGDRVRLVLGFGDGTDLETEAKIVGPADPAPY
ncbi:copper chaperone PCu(A)C [Stakelama saccharophila]|uniref:Copper chaperone PCu(A)C n=1 Tax=Stakelama saccharophila TaxID=3075605 RepID=A0ABZ0BC61_9SPHN|nr:copper chaperone PCu(A)C [Stakelama sp. W311]WNO54646.1 copper chaperone PCu(A)C [Stakelama sp. W311]